MRRIIRFFIISILSVLLLLGLYFAVIYLSPKPPIEEIGSARNALSEAWSKGAGNYTPRMMKQAQELYDSAMIIWKNENERFLLFRDYEIVRKKAIESCQIAIEATGYTEKTSDNLKDAGKARINELRLKVSKSSPLFSRLPLPVKIRNDNTKGKLLLGEAENSFHNGDYIKTQTLLIEAKGLLDSSYDFSDRFVTDYFSSYPEWTRWVKKTIEDSRKNRSTAIIVDKFDRKCFIYQSGKLKNTFNAELGKNWIGHKKVKGDNSTPEGMYSILKKKDSKNTIYYKALLINYPNPEDKEEFNREKNKGNISRNSTIGSLIEIHGQGGKGVDWTNGCIALTDKEMDIIYKLSAVGTPITIVGSLKQLSEVINR